jgi:hypothetical protein
MKTILLYVKYFMEYMDDLLINLYNPSIEQPILVYYSTKYLPKSNKECNQEIA